MRSWMVATKVVGWNGYDRERADPLPGRRVFPIFPDPGDAEGIAVPPGDGVPLTAVVLLKEAVHRNDAAPLSVGVAELLVLGDGFGTRMDRREIRTLQKCGMRPQRRWPSTGRPVSGCRR
jgi:hypothetical protein